MGCFSDAGGKNEAMAKAFKNIPLRSDSTKRF